MQPYGHSIVHRPAAPPAASEALLPVDPQSICEEVRSRGLYCRPNPLPDGGAELQIWMSGQDGVVAHIKLPPPLPLQGPQSTGLVLPAPPPSEDEYKCWVAFLRSEALLGQIPVAVASKDDSRRDLQAQAFHKLGVAAVLVDPQQHPYGLPPSSVPIWQGLVTFSPVHFRAVDLGAFSVTQTQGPGRRMVMSVKVRKHLGSWVVMDKLVFSRG